MAKTIMLQGTMSNVGKSFLTAALCRIFRQDGYSCAPFKSQNMALNSYVTADGLEIGRAQAMQAQAAGIEPSALMNPILLKPTTDTGSQVIVSGRVRGNMRARDYFRHKTELIPEILEAYRTLAAQYDIVVIEGAGSPVELNLKADDIVNMGLAALVRSPVLLVGDIDRGGIFAQLLGTLGLLEPAERDMVKGLIVNQFRGDRALFQDGVEILEERSRKPVAGVIPFISCDLEDEDSLSGKLEQQMPGKGVDIAVIRLPKISNFTDFDVFSQYDKVSVRYVTRPELLGKPDLLILPGTKSTIADLQWMRETGMADAACSCAAQGIPVFGICGGYQLMGESVSDPLGCEGGGTAQGLGLLRGKTVFGSEKQQRRTQGHFSALSGFFGCLSGAPFEGYEIHMGRTEDPGMPLTDRGGSIAGDAAGCYIHGIFDRAEISGALVRALAARKGISCSTPAVSRHAYRDMQFDLLADAVRESMDMQLIYRILEEGL